MIPSIFLAVDKWNAFPPVATKSSCFKLKQNDQAADAFLRSCLELSHEWMSLDGEIHGVPVNEGKDLLSPQML